MVIRPYSYAILGNIQKILDHMFKDTDHENVYMSVFIPESLLQNKAESTDKNIYS